MSVSLSEDGKLWRNGGIVVSIISKLVPKWDEILAKCYRRFAIRPKDVPVSDTGIECLVVFLSTSVYE